MNKDDFVAWVERYLQAWSNNEPNDIGRLFTEGAAYFTSPFDEPWRGCDGIIEGWLGRKDEPGNFKFDYEVLAVDGELGIVRGVTLYLNPPKEYANIWLIKLNNQGQCTEFIEYCERK